MNQFLVALLYLVIYFMIGVLGPLSLWISILKPVIILEIVFNDGRINS